MQQEEACMNFMLNKFSNNTHMPCGIYNPTTLDFTKIAMPFAHMYFYKNLQEKKAVITMFTGCRYDYN